MEVCPFWALFCPVPDAGNIYFVRNDMESNTISAFIYLLKMFQSNDFLFWELVWVVSMELLYTIFTY